MGKYLDELLSIQGEKIASVSDSQKAQPENDMLEAWRMAYKAFKKFSPALRSGATDQEAAAAFQGAAEAVGSIYQIGGDAEVLAVHVYGMLEDVYKNGKAVVPRNPYI